jgi:capsular polysaccharide biosynthesis protein
LSGQVGDSYRYLEALRRRWWVALTAFIVTTAATLALVLPQPSVYEATGTLVIGPRYSDREETVEALETLSDGETITATYASIARSDLIRRRAVERFGTSVSASDLTVGAEVMIGTNVLSISVRGHEPEPVRAFAEAIAAETVAYVDELNDTYELKPLDPPQLTRQPVGSSKPLTVALGMVLAAMLGAGLALLADFIGGSTVASWPGRAESPTRLLNGPSIIDPEEFLSIFWHQASLSEREGYSFSFGILHVALRNEQRNEISYELGNSHLMLIADLLQPDLGHKGALTYLGYGTLAVMLPDTPIAEVETLMSDWKDAIASVGDRADGEANSRLQISTGLLTSLTTISPEPGQVTPSHEAEVLSTGNHGLHTPETRAERAWA